MYVIDQKTGAKCGKKYRLKGSLCTHVTNAHKSKLDNTFYIKDDNVTHETFDDYKERTKAKTPVGTFQVVDV